jgi:uncharacterized RDD family membrane protein YckC
VELDERVTLPGAEGIDLDLVLAGIGSRGAALAVDLGVQFVAAILVFAASAPFGRLGPAVLSVGAFALWFGYPILTEAFNDGQTLGKQAFGIAVVREDGTPVGFVAAAIRAVVRLIDLLPGVFTVGLVSMVVTRRCQRLGDLAAGTLVVRRSRRPQLAVGGPVGLDPAAGGWAVPPEIATWDTTGVTLDELAAIRAFLDRRHQLALEHRATIAATLAGQVAPKVVGVPVDGGPELFLERVAYARSFRGPGA